MAQIKQPRLRVFVDEDPDIIEERKQRMDALKKKYPGGIAVIQPICDRVGDPGFERPRPEDKMRPRCTHVKVDTWRRNGTHPATGMPNLTKELVTIDLIDPQLKWPIDVRTDQIKQLGPNVIDKWELIEFLEEHPACNKDFKLLAVDPVLDKRIKDGLKAPGAKAVLKEVTKRSSDAAKGKATDVTAPKAEKRGVVETGVTMDDLEEQTEDELVEA
jgi:hypothetical protein